MAIPDPLDRSLKNGGSTIIAEAWNEARSAANNKREWPLAQIVEVLDARLCPLCEYVNGMTMRVDSPEYAQWRNGSHIHCRRCMAYIHRDEGHAPTFKQPPQDLIDRYGHFHTDPEAHAALRIPAEPAGRSVTVRTVRDLKTGKTKRALEWAPWWDQVPKWKRDVVLKARAATTEDELRPLLEKLDVPRNPQTADQVREVALLGLKDRLEGWVTVEAASGAAGAAETSDIRLPELVRGLLDKSPPAGPIPPGLDATREEAEQWARENVLGLTHVDYSEAAPPVIHALNEVAAAVSQHFQVPVPVIAPFSHFGETPEKRTIMSAGVRGITYNPAMCGVLEEPLTFIAHRDALHSADAAKDWRGIVAHEVAHVLQKSGRDQEGKPRGAETSERLARNIVKPYRDSAGEKRVRAELGNQAWTGSNDPENPWQETWAQAFAAAWVNAKSLRPKTRQMVKDVLRKLFPGLKLWF
jgi:hypothetical protein